jgi:tartrate-resistant acid phosphatase type 5
VRSSLAACVALCLLPACEPPPSFRYLGAGPDAGSGPCIPLDPQLGAADRLATHFAAIGDYGYAVAGSYEAPVAMLVDNLQPDFVITLGDNNYVDGSAAWIDRNIGQYYSHYISPYVGQFGPGASENRFFPSLGNHDWLTPGAQPYLDYFTLPGNERYYDIVRGDVHLFAIDSDANEPDGVTADSVQARWLRDALAASTARWRIVYMHHPPYSSGSHGSTVELQWPFRDWGASLVLAGHDHTYERLSVGGLTYIICGLSGNPELYALADPPLAGSVTSYVANHGALIIDADDTRLRVRLCTVGTPQPIDEVVLTSP